jgi:hypothetical protein
MQWSDFSDDIVVLFDLLSYETPQICRPNSVEVINFPWQHAPLVEPAMRQCKNFMLGHVFVSIHGKLYAREYLDGELGLVFVESTSLYAVVFYNGTRKVACIAGRHYAQ